MQDRSLLRRRARQRKPWTNQPQVEVWEVQSGLRIAEVINQSVHLDFDLSQGDFARVDVKHHWHCQ